MKTQHEISPEIRLRPATGRCELRVGLDPGGKPVRCVRHAIARMADGTALCKEHLEERMHQLVGEYHGTV